jgi:CheY-like chemotaxis protein
MAKDAESYLSLSASLSLMTLRILIPRGSRVFLLEDDDVRIRWFLERLTSTTVAKEVPDAIAILDSYPPFDFLFLDHDLGLFTGTEGDGLQVAQHLAGRGFDGLNTFIHSTSQNGATAMQGALKNATAVPFGQFEIESMVRTLRRTSRAQLFSS